MKSFDYFAPQSLGDATALLIRPDGYLGAVSVGPSVDALLAAAAKWSIPSAGSSAKKSISHVAAVHRF